MEQHEQTTTDPPRWKAVGPPYLLTRAELLDELHTRGFKVSEAQLRSWVTQGVLLPRPERRVPPGATDGVARALYPLWTIGMIFGILEKMQRGSSINELKEQAPSIAQYWEQHEQAFLSRSATENIVGLPVSPGATRALERAVWDYVELLTRASRERVAAATLTLQLDDGTARTLSLRPYPMTELEKSDEYLKDD